MRRSGGDAEAARPRPTPRRGLADDQSCRIFNVIDDYARDALAIEIDVSLTAQRVVRVLERLCEWHGTPESIRSGDGPQFRAEVLQEWAKSKGIRSDFIQPGCPAQHRYVERFNGTHRPEVHDANQFRPLDEARAITNEWLAIYNEKRTHSAIGHLPPLTFKRRCRQRQFPDMTGFGRGALTPGHNGQRHRDTNVRKFADPANKYLGRWELLGLG